MFQVGYRGVEKHGYYEDDIDRVLKSKVSMIKSKFPFVIEFASASEFKLNFKNKIMEDDLLEFTKFFSQDEDSILSGLDGYIIFAEDGDIFRLILEDNCFLLLLGIETEMRTTQSRQRDEALGSKYYHRSRASLLR